MLHNVQGAVCGGININFHFESCIFSIKYNISFNSCTGYFAIMQIAGICPHFNKLWHIMCHNINMCHLYGYKFDLFGFNIKVSASKFQCITVNSHRKWGLKEDGAILLHWFKSDINHQSWQFMFYMSIISHVYINLLYMDIVFLLVS